MNWTILVALIAVTIVIDAIVATLASRRGYRHGMQQSRDERIALKVEREEARTSRDKLNTERDILSREVRKSEDAIAYYVGEIQQLHAQLADRNEALQEAQAEIKLRDGEKADLWFKIAQLEDEESARRAEEVNATVPMQDAIKSDMPLTYAEAKPAIDKAAQSTKRPPRKKAGEP